MAGIGIDTSAVSSATTSSTSSSSSSLDKDAFLQLLVTQMQYQDPLEPTSNTEYMSQLAQFSTVEEIQNMSTSFSNTQAMNLTGQYVILNVPDATGNITQVSGLVDYVTLNDGKTYFHVNDDYYSSDYLDSVVSLDYLEHLVNSSTTTEDGTTTDTATDAGATGTDTAQQTTGDGTTTDSNDDSTTKTDGADNA